MEQFQEKVNELFAKHETLLSRKNIPLEDGNGIFTRYQLKMESRKSGQGTANSGNVY